jgi:hypothetical protein
MPPSEILKPMSANNGKKLQEIRKDKKLVKEVLLYPLSPEEATKFHDELELLVSVEEELKKDIEEEKS